MSTYFILHCSGFRLFVILTVPGILESTYALITNINTLLLFWFIYNTESVNGVIDFYCVAV